MEARARHDQANLPILPENWPAVSVFTAMSTQWRRAGMSGVPVGLDYAALPAVCAALDHRLDGELLTRITMIECAALAVMAERR
jgi:hypothetical protein